ncbi:Oidioi.mRNA.OKI2018_I69.PAR.g10551.t1.cds [Oikopleura dioica]|uniref:Oidioi.mRNA.OKI2018_I69.PAR.g10551.t1.cds n=1 Tax=Oikopleura dioica TaxID=34765 RepID=A0ABN7RWD7_OIKDI|nr:Oidioi.mRNA.OKI2018_I69.PAR.g10551.t1.cds [Oikopleura dioica]
MNQLKDNQIYRQFEKYYQPVRQRRLKRWNALLKIHTVSPDEKSPKLKRFVRKGVPHKYRAKVWMQLTNAQSRMENSLGLYQDLLTRVDKDFKTLEQIELDIHRTFPDNKFFKDGKEDRKKLYNVLVAFAEYNKEIGYCQGMNYIAGLIVLVVREEEKAFWLLVCLIEEILPEDYFCQKLTGITRDCSVLGDLVKDRILGTGDGHDDQWDLVTAKWFICLYIDVLPIQTTLRIWDCLLFEGDTVLFRVGITLFNLRANQLAKASSIVDVIDGLGNFAIEKQVVNCHHFMNLLFEDKNAKVSREIIEDIRDDHRPIQRNKPKRMKTMLIHQCTQRLAMSS